MNRRELLKAIPGVVALTPIAIDTPSKDGKETSQKAYRLEEGPFYLFVVNACEADTDVLIDILKGTKVSGGIVCARDPEKFCRIYKLEE